MYRKNVASQNLPFVLIKASDGTALTGATVTARRSIDGGAQASATGTVSELANGQYNLALSQADTNGNQIGILLTATGAIPVHFSLVTTAGDPTDAVRFGLTALPNAAAAATGGVPTVDGSNAVRVQSGTGANQISLASGLVTAGTVATGAITSGSFASGAIDAAAIATDAIGSAELAASAVTEIQAAIAAGAVASVTGAVGSVTGNVGGNVTGSVGSVASGGITAGSFAAGAIDAAAIATDAIGSAELAASAVSEIQSGLATSSAQSTILSGVAAIGLDTDDIQNRLPSALVSGKIDASVGAMAANTLTASALATDAVTEIQTGITAPSAAAVAAQIVNTVLAELPQALVSATPTVGEALMLAFMMIRNGGTATSAQATVKNDAGSVVMKRTLTDDGTTFTEGRLSAGP